nr:uncharacterized protein LOC128669726 [Plodia interpunctella]XP_053611149.1 uncharacterized protein LOC128675642 [Plodia interpunctella]
MPSVTFFKMALENRPVDVRLRQDLSDQEIDNILNESEFDYFGDDSVGDPEFLPPNLNEKRQDRQNSDSSSSNDDTSTFTAPTASPAFSDYSNDLTYYLPHMQDQEDEPEENLVVARQAANLIYMTNCNKK